MKNDHRFEFQQLHMNALQEDNLVYNSPLNNANAICVVGLCIYARYICTMYIVIWRKCNFWFVHCAT